MKLPGQAVLVLQGGGALGAYQAGVYEALHEAGIEPDWVIGISIGALNGAIIAANAPQERLPRLREFWTRVQNDSPLDGQWWPGLGHAFSSWSALVRGIPAMYAPRPPAWGGVSAQVGVEKASYYVTEPLRETLGSLIDFASLGSKSTRLTVGAVNVTHGTMRYFDSREEALVIFDVNVWQPTGPEPQSIWQVMGRQKDIQYASRSDSHIARQKQIHKLRHIIRELAKHTTEAEREHAHLRGLGLHGCNTTMHVVRLLAPTLDSEDYFKDIDFSAARMQARWQAGIDDTRRMIGRAPWNEPADPMEGVIVHELSARAGG